MLCVWLIVAVGYICGICLYCVVLGGLCLGFVLHGVELVCWGLVCTFNSVDWLVSLYWADFRCYRVCDSMLLLVVWIAEFDVLGCYCCGSGFKFGFW